MGFRSTARGTRFADTPRRISGVVDEKPLDVLTSETFGGPLGRGGGRRSRSGVVLCCYEVGPLGYGLTRELERLGLRRVVLAPALTPIRNSGPRKTKNSATAL
jgi:hypothetical protein